MPAQLDADSAPDPMKSMVEEIVGELLQTGNVVTPLDVLLALEIIDADRIEAWRRGALPYLERGITKGLARVARVLGLIRETALARGLEPVPGKYVRRGKGPKHRLRFSKRGDRGSELAYGTHFVRRRSEPPAGPTGE